MPSFAETELILTPEGRVYHLGLRSEDIADDVILVGDPGRVAQISAHFSHIGFKAANREFITHTGFYRGKRFTVLSTGIGTGNIDIVLNELDAAVNIDPNTRTLIAQKRRLNLIRLGTCGALQANLPVNSLVASAYALGLDGLLHFYEQGSTVNEHALCASFIKHSQWPQQLTSPYGIRADEELLKTLAGGLHHGITATAPGFYGPQGRQLRLKATLPGLNELLSSFNFNDLCITNFEMETSALYGLGKLLGHHCLTLCVVIANRVTKEFTGSYHQSVDLLIQRCLTQLSNTV